MIGYKNKAYLFVSKTKYKTETKKKKKYQDSREAGRGRL